MSYKHLWWSVPQLVLVLTFLGWAGSRLWSEYQKPNLKRVLPQPELEAVIRERWNLDELELVESAPGQFTGSGRGNDGFHYRFRVVQTQGKRRIDYQYGESGDDGTIRLDGREGGGGFLADSW